MPIEYQKVKKDVCHRMGMAIAVLKKEFAGLRTGRASPSLLEAVMVESYGTMTPLFHLATISVPEPRLLIVQVWDKSTLKAVEKAIRDAGLGLNPAIDGQNIRVPIPFLNAERRNELSKIAHRYAEQARIAVRHVRRDGMESLKRMEKDGTVSQDLQRQQSHDVQIVTDEHIQQIDTLLMEKEKEIIQV